MRLFPGTILIALLVFGSINVTPIHAQVSTTFDTNLEGWTVTGDNSATWESSTGNPGGCLSVNDQATGDMIYAVAPLTYHGDWSGMSTADSLSAEIFHSSSDPDDLPPDYIFRIAGPGGSAYALSGAMYQPVKDVWNRYAVPLDSLAWTIESGTWTAILEHVNSVRICGEFTDGDETCRLDNIYLSSAPPYLASSCVYDVFNDGTTGDWSFSEIDGASNPGSGGNGGGYVKINDGTGISKAYAPAKFLGDWSSLDDAFGKVEIEIRVISHPTYNLGIAEFIRISGPGGSAHVDLDPDNLPESRHVWARYMFPLMEGLWTVDSGTWTALLANVTECRVTVEFFDGSETIGFDNFSRVEYGCPIPDMPVEVTDRYIGFASYGSFVNLASVAYNPQDTELYGVVHEYPGSFGGLYPISGLEYGNLIQSYDRPIHLIFDDDGDCYISENYSGEIHRLEWGGSSSLWVDEFRDGADDDPCGMTFAPSGFTGPNVNPGDILVVDAGAGTGAYDCAYAFSPDTAQGERLLLPDPGSYDFYDMAAGPGDTVYVCDGGNINSLFMLDSFGTLTPVTLNTTESLLITSVVYDDVEDVLYVADTNNMAVYRIVPSNGSVHLVADGFSNFLICSLEINTIDRKLYVTDNGYNRVYVFLLYMISAAGDRTLPTPGSVSLEAYPNPFNPSATIRFNLQQASDVRLEVYDVTGRRVATLFDGKMESGPKEIRWDSRNTRNEVLSSGVYFIRVKAGDYSQTKKMVLLK